jgi:hypothetical protein
MWAVTHVMTPAGTVSDQNLGGNYKVTFVDLHPLHSLPRSNQGGTYITITCMAAASPNYSHDKYP